MLQSFRESLTQCSIYLDKNNISESCCQSSISIIGWKKLQNVNCAPFCKNTLCGLSDVYL